MNPMDPTKKRKLDDNGLPLPGSGLNQLSVEDARKIVEPLTQDQLLQIVQNAAIIHLDVLDAVRSIADRDATQRKLFIRGLGWETTTEKLRGVFSVFGELEEAVVILDKTTGKSKGYGFVTFKHMDGALLALKEPSKNIDGRMTVTQLASAGIQGTPAGLPVGAVDVSARKIYVANVPHEMPGNRLLNHFLSYGEIEEGPLGFDKATGKSKGYTLFVYKTAEGARAALVDPVKNIDGHQLTCKLASEGKKGKPGVPAGAAPVETPGQVPSQFGNPAAGSYGGFPGGFQGLPLGHNPNPSVVGGPGLSTAPSQAPPTMGIGSGYGAGIGGNYGGALYGGPGSVGYGGYGAPGGGFAGSGGYGRGLGVSGGYVGGLGASGGYVGGLGASGGFEGGLGVSGGAGGGGGGGLGAAESGGVNAGRASGMYGIPPNSAGIPSGGYPEGVRYSLSSSFPNPQPQQSGKSPGPRAPGGLLQSGRPFY